MESGEVHPSEATVGCLTLKAEMTLPLASQCISTGVLTDSGARVNLISSVVVSQCNFEMVRAEIPLSDWDDGTHTTAA